MGSTKLGFMGWEKLLNVIIETQECWYLNYDNF
jgi:hypothetical protein